ncbi:hypothetical protein INT47_010079 [Mucor saturninus]|uniref:UvrD-like helicase C-terminal domain-containing protein n=1 Tax=Mucor saturninus TaxID=64648 RepID=A0A8H7R2U6_9FUNG|nr:hypothetical protein INT47_010079 [Mucor saturninus]
MVRNMNSAILANMATESAVSVGFDRVLRDCANDAAVKHMLDSVATDSVHTVKNLGVMKHLRLQIEARYMITSNLDTSDGLVNVTTGYLQQIDYGTLKGSSGGEKKPLRIWIKFDDETSGLILRKKQTALRSRTRSVLDNWTMIEPVSLQITSNRKTNLRVNRKQFPIVPAEVLTIHKFQGGTYENVVVYDVGKHKMQRSLIYVACSRATIANGLTLICKNNTFVPPKPLSSEKSSDLYLEMQRQPTHA